MLLLLLLIVLCAVVCALNDFLGPRDPAYYCQCLKQSRIIRGIGGCGQPSNGPPIERRWSRFDRFDKRWIVIPSEKDGCDNYCGRNDGTLLIVEAIRGRDDTRYKCQHENITTFHTIALYNYCYCEPKILDPPTDLTRRNLPGNHRTFSCSAYVGPCSVNNKCSTPRANVTWTFRRRHDNDVISSEQKSDPRGSGVVETQMNYDSKTGNTKISSTYTIESVDWNNKDYGSYTCTITNEGGSLRRTVQLEYGVAENTVVVPPPVIWFFLTVAVVVVCTLVLITAALGYYFLLRIRVIYHLHFHKPERGDYKYDGVVISTDSRSDVAYVKEKLLMTAEESMNFNLAWACRDFDVASDDASYLEFMRMSRRLIYVISPDFLHSDYAVCLRTFRDAWGLERPGDMIFIVLPDIDNQVWTRSDLELLKQTMDLSSARFDWGVQRKFCCFDLSSWEEHGFWDRFLLAMPKATSRGNLVLEIVDQDDDNDILVG